MAINPSMRRLAAMAGVGALAVLPLSASATHPAAMHPAAMHPAAPHGLDARAGRMVPATSVPLLYERVGKPAARPPLFTCQSARALLPCYGPAQLRRAYDVPRSLDGAGQTIVIVDAYQSPAIRSDLRLFDSTFGLPDPRLTIKAPAGLTPYNPADADQASWSGEITLDVEYAHAIAPRAKIDLVLAASDEDADIYAAQRYAIGRDLGGVLSQSFGEAESCMDPTLMARAHRLFVTAQAERMSVFASSGDDGAAEPDCNGDGGYFLSVSTPASDPLVTAVGGTHLNADFGTGGYGSETTWNDSGNPGGDLGASGGGFSTVYARPSYQQGIATHGTRGVPDISYSADVTGGVLVAWDPSGHGTGSAFYVFGGTSAGSPQWAGIAALADQAAHRRLGFLSPALYTIGSSPAADPYAFRDVTNGTNTWDVSGVPGYLARRGWDPVTGLGTPDVARLLQLLS
jgi:subtilase family serine protease